MSKDEFIRDVLKDIPPPPQYFAENAKMNKRGYTNFETVLKKGDTPYGPEEFEKIANYENALILDVRDEQEFLKAHIPNSIFIGINGSFAPWVGALITDLKQPILLVTPQGKEKETVTRLSRVGYDNTLGYLKDGITAWKQAGKDLDSIKSISVDTFSNHFENENIHVLDVRKDGEYKSEHLKGDNVQHFPLDFINKNMSKIDKNKTYYIYCAGGYRSAIASSILKARGFNNLVDIIGGFGAIKKTNLPKTNFVCPTSL